MLVDIIFAILGLLAIVVAVASCRAGTRSDMEIEKIIKKQENEKSNLQR